MSTTATDNENLSGITNYWFETTSQKIKEGTFKYPKRRRKLIDKPKGGTRPLTTTNPRVKIIEKAILTAIEPLFEGIFDWRKITKETYEDAKKKGDTQNYRAYPDRYGKMQYEQKIRLHETKFSSHSYGFRPHKSAHQALHNIKNWRTTTTFFIDYDIKKAYDTVNRNRLKNIFLSTVKDVRIWIEIDKMLNTGIEQDLLEIFEGKGVRRGSILSPLLFNIYMHPLDEFIKEYRKTKEKIIRHEDPEYGDKEAELNYRRISRLFSSDTIRRTLREM